MCLVWEIMKPFFVILLNINEDDAFAAKLFA